MNDNNPELCCLFLAFVKMVNDEKKCLSWGVVGGAVVIKLYEYSATKQSQGGRNPGMKKAIFKACNSE